MRTLVAFGFAVYAGIESEQGVGENGLVSIFDCSHARGQATLMRMWEPLAVVLVVGLPMLAAIAAWVCAGPGTLGRLFCLLTRGHDYRTRGEGSRAFLECADCQARTSGWNLETRYHYSELQDEGFRLLLAEDVGTPALISVQHGPRVASTPFRLEFDA